uniref:nucleoporin NUP42 n=1 Tax=Scatophagus argus TaxID=75038 RepID=UPI001ED81A48|nr:nucleoporin NUP42 [Scatophagus argus]
MTVCSFFLQGRCRYGEKCWNEHPRGGNRGGGGYNNSNRSSAQQQQRGGGFGNKVWVNPSQQKGGYIQPSSFSSHGSDDWGQGGGGGGRRDNIKSSEFSFSAQNRFSTLAAPSTFDKGGRGGGQQIAARDEDDDKKLEFIQMDMDIWESSGQWCFSCYSNFKTSLSGFTDLSPEELRLEYYSTRASGDLQGYINGINQLLSQWRGRVQELKIMSPATRQALLAELNNPAPQTSSGGFDSMTAPGFGSSTPSFGSKSGGFGSPAPVQASTFSFAAPSGGFGSSAAPSSSTGFGSALAAPTQPPSGFGSSSAASSALSAASFSFSGPTSNSSSATSGFGSASGFSFSSTANAGSTFGSGFGVEAGSSSVFGQTSGGFGASAAPPAAGAVSAGGETDGLFSPKDKLTPEELNQFKAKRFTLGQIPLKPPPADILVV